MRHNVLVVYLRVDVGCVLPLRHAVFVHRMGITYILSHSSGNPLRLVHFSKPASGRKARIYTHAYSAP